MTRIWQHTQHALRRLKDERRPLRFLLSRLLWRSRACYWLEIPRAGYRLKFFPTALSTSLWLDPQERGLDEEFFRALLSPGDCVIDVGANIGDLTLLAATRVGQEGRVYAFEAHPRTFDFLTRNIRLNGLTQIEAHCLALGDQDTITAISDRASDDQNGIAAVGDGIDIPLRRLDGLALSADTVHLLKIDVEGYEKFVLGGSPQLLEKTQCLYFESWDRHFARYGYQTADLIAMLQSLGFQVFRWSRAGLEPFSPPFVSPRCENLVATRDVAWLQARLEKGRAAGLGAS